jgi:glutaredoxin 3
MAARVDVYTTTYCPWCVRAKQLLAHKGIAFAEIDVTGDDERRAWLVETTGRKTVPQIFIDGRAVGGYDDLAALDKRGELDRLLAGAA